MSRLFYMSLVGVGAWDMVLKESGAQLRPYVKYLETAITVAQRRKPVLAWRRADPQEHEVFERRLTERMEQQARRAMRSKKRRERHLRGRPSGTWVVLGPPPWSAEEPESTFDALLGAEEVYDQQRCPRERALKVLERDHEGLALLLPVEPDEIDPPEPAAQSAEVEVPPEPTADAPFGPLLFVSPNTYPLSRQLAAIRTLENRPASHLSPLMRLVSTRPTWPDVAPLALGEEDWVFLRAPGDGGPMRDGADEQREFVQVALATPDFAVLEGPPGSGKTTAICELIVQLARQRKRVLLCASTHVAVDNVLERLLAWQDPAEEKLVLPVRIGDEERITSDVIVPWTYQRLLRTWRDELLDFLDAPRGTGPGGDEARKMLRDALNSPAQGGQAPIERLILESANLVCGTTIGILQHPAIKATKDGASFEPFDVMILDEASKTTFAEFLVPALHAKRWIIVGDIRQLAPYVEEADLRASLRGLVPIPNARAATYAFLASDLSRPRRRCLVEALSAEESGFLLQESDARKVLYVDLDQPETGSLRGVPRAIPGLLFADLVFGSAEALERFEHRLPGDLEPTGGLALRLPDWAAHHRAVQEGRQHDPTEWSAEVAWRLVRSYELRQNQDERERYLDALDGLTPVTLTEEERERLGKQLNTLRRVAFPSILELIQRGFERLDGWDQDVALTAGLPQRAFEQRMVSLHFQHRMHPDISAFPRERFYSDTDYVDSEESVEDDVEVAPRPDEEISWETFGEEAADYEEGEPNEPLLQDARTMSTERAWSYRRYARRALWIGVAPRKGKQGSRSNRNPDEVDAVMEELKHFVAWAQEHLRRDKRGEEIHWTVAVLTYYRGQESLFRERLKELTGQYGNTRNFHLPRGRGAVHVTLCTVDRFQGHEADLVFLSFVKSGSIGFLNSPNRLNVALTRARYQLVLVGHQAYFASERCPSKLLRSIADSAHYRGDIKWES